MKKASAEISRSLCLYLTIRTPGTAPQTNQIQQPDQCKNRHSRPTVYSIKEPVKHTAYRHPKCKHKQRRKWQQSRQHLCAKHQQAAQQQAEEAACALQAEAEALQELGIALAQSAEKAETLTALAAQQRSQLAAKQEEGRQLEAAQADVTEQLAELKRSQSALENSSSLTEAEAAKAVDAIAAAGV